MKFSAAIFFCVLFALISDASAWRRRRRRRRYCAPQSCRYTAKPWSACNCQGIQYRSISIQAYPRCGGSACPSTWQQRRCTPYRCQHGTCAANGRCQCSAGYTGSTCAKKCPRGTYGQNCASRCSSHCPPGVNCNPVSGFCECPAGRTGANCQHPYKCAIGGVCQSVHPKKSKRNCYLQIQSTTKLAKTYSSCFPGFNVDQCYCFKDCQKYTIENKTTCRCGCKAPNTYPYIVKVLCCKSVAPIKTV